MAEQYEVWTGGPLQARLAKAVWKNDYSEAEAALAEGADPNMPDVVGFAPLEMAVYRGDVPIIRLLFDRGASFPANSFDGRTLWIRARAYRHAEIARILKQRGCEPTLFDSCLAVYLRLRRWWRNRS